MSDGNEKALTTEDLAGTEERKTAQPAPPPDERAVPAAQTADQALPPETDPNSPASTGAPQGDAVGGPGGPATLAEGGTRALAGQQRQAEAGARSAAPPAETHLISLDAATKYQARWTEVQAAFVDEPRQTLEQADGLVAEVIQLLTRTFADERSKLEEQWTSGAEVSTEEMRLAFQRYRTFFNSLLR